jgi:hypothetical protein
MILIGVLVLLQWLIFSYTLIMIAATAMTIAVTWLIHKQIVNTQWRRISFAKDLV